MDSSVRRILIINPFGIGDVLFTTPLVRAIRQAFPTSFIGYLCNGRTKRILRDNPHLDELFVYEKDDMTTCWKASRRQGASYVLRLLRRLRRARFDLAIDLSLGERYSLVSKLLGIRRRVGFNYRRRGRFLTDHMSIDGYHDVHVVEYYRRLLRFLGVELLDPSLELQTSDEDERWASAWLDRQGLEQDRPLVGMVPAGGVSWGRSAAYRRWSYEGFAAVGDALVERFGARLILFGEAADRAACTAVGRLMKAPVVDVSGQTNLGQFIALIGRLELVICNDGGPLHLAVSQRIKTVSIFGPVDPNVYGPYPRTADHRIVVRPELLCRPCYHQFKLPPCPYERACLTLIEPEQVLEACERLLGPAQPAEAGGGHGGG